MESKSTHEKLQEPLKPGRDLDALVAEKVMGLKQIWDLEDKWFMPTDPPTTTYLPKYSTDKSAAKQVIYAMVDKPKEIQDRFFNAIGFSSPEILSRQEDSTWTDTVDPLQVCLAALKALGAL